LQLVTVLHPGDFIENLRQWPHLVKSRAARSALQQKLAENRNLEGKPRYVPGTVIVDYGEPDGRNQGSYFIRAAHLVEFLADPRLLFMPDNKPRFRWKLEFRHSWQDDPQAAMNDEQRQALLSEISKATLIVKALWQNQSLAPNAPLQIGVNLVLVPVKNVLDAQEGSFRFERSGGSVWIEW
jgi:hypothetical protein